MADKALHQMISAYVTGCLDRDNFIQFRKYVREGGELPEGELGELQNLMSLVPTLLEMESPPEETKDKIAQRLIELKDEIKTKIREEKLTASEERKTVAKTTAAPPEQSTTNVKTELKSKPLHDGEPQTHTRKQTTKIRETTPEPKQSSGFTWVLTSILFLILIAVIIYFHTINSALEQEISDIKNQLAGFQDEISNTNKFINDHLSLIEFFNYRNVEIVNLANGDVNTNSSGKLLISFESGEALLQLRNIPQLAIDETYQLWMVSSDLSYSLGTIIPQTDMKFYKISNIPFVPREQVDMFRITKEPRGGSDLPSGTTYLYGVFYKEPESNTRRR